MGDAGDSGTTGVAAWLRELGLERYAAAFAANDIDWETLPRLAARDLHDVGVESIGHRRILLDAIAELDRAPARPVASRAERRQLTVLFADLVGATQLSTELDPEDLRAVYRLYQDACAQSIERFGGHVAQLLGDGVVAYFGHPRAHEDDAERAARAGLELVRSVQAMHSPRGTPLLARVGIATGVVVVGDVIETRLGEERPVVGETPNLAARLQAIAPPGGVVLGARTRRLIRGRLELVELGAHEFKGFAQPIEVWQVAGERRGGGPGSQEPLVDRRRELATLRRRWHLATQGDAQGVMLEGPPGIGKSRLIRALVGEVGTGPSTVLRYFCSPYHTTNSLYPVAAQLEHAAGIERDEPAHVRRDKLEALLGPGSGAPGGRGDTLGPLIGLETSAAITPQLLKTRLFEALFATLGELCSSSPVLVVVEDVHWSDSTTAELLEGILGSFREQPLLLVATQRPEATLGLLGGEDVSRLALEPLDREDCAEIVEGLAGQPISAETLESILDNADGVPLFVEELAKNLLERSGESGSERVPATLEDALTERLDRLGDARWLAQVASVAGRQVTLGLLAAVARTDPGLFQEQVEQLVGAGLLLPREESGEATYRFKHALVQQAAYGMLLRDERADLHARVVEVLEQTDRAAVERTPELLARHCAAAGLTEKAVAYWRAAGDRAMRQSADAEAIASYREALGLLATLEPEDDTYRLEIDLLTALGVPLLAIHGVASPEPEAVYLRARQLATEIGAGRELFPVLWGLAVVSSGRGEMRRAAETADELLAIAASEGDRELELEAHHAAWVYDFFLGRLPEAADHVAAGQRAAQGVEVDEHALLYGGHDPRLCARNFEALLARLDGREAVAAELGDETFELALASRHLHTRAHCVAWGAIADQLGGRVDAVVRRIDVLKALADEHGFTEFSGEARVLGGWALAMRGDPVRALAEIGEGIALREAAGMQHLMPYLLGVSASVHILAGEPGAA
nr:AAA family ATPase [Actinomycetota bacterium]